MSGYGGGDYAGQCEAHFQCGEDDSGCHGCNMEQLRADLAAALTRVAELEGERDAEKVRGDGLARMLADANTTRVKIAAARDAALRDVAAWQNLLEVEREQHGEALGALRERLEEAARLLGDASPRADLNIGDREAWFYRRAQSFGLGVVAAVEALAREQAPAFERRPSLATPVQRAPHGCRLSCVEPGHAEWMAAVQGAPPETIPAINGPWIPGAAPADGPTCKWCGGAGTVWTSVRPGPARAGGGQSRKVPCPSCRPAPAVPEPVREPNLGLAPSHAASPLPKKEKKPCEPWCGKVMELSHRAWHKPNGDQRSFCTKACADVADGLYFGDGPPFAGPTRRDGGT
jgi:hypothetical protein